MLTSFYDIARQVHENNYYQYVENNYIGTELSIENTYNDRIKPTLYGKAYQDKYRVGVLSPTVETTENVEIKQWENADDKLYGFWVTPSVDCVVTRCGRNLYDFNLLPITKYGMTVSKDTNNNIVINGRPTITTGFISMNVGYTGFVKNNYYINSVKEKIDGIGVTNVFVPGGGINLTMSETITYKKNLCTENSSGYIDINIRNDIQELSNFILNPQLELGTTQHPYEPYQGQNYILQANTRTFIPALDGVNTLFCDTGTMKIEAVDKNQIVQFEDGQNGTEMIVTSDVDCTVTRCGRNLLQPYNYDFVSQAGTASAFEEISSMNYLKVTTLADNTTGWAYGILGRQDIIKKCFLPDTSYTFSGNKTSNLSLIILKRGDGTSPLSSVGNRNPDGSYTIKTTGYKADDITIFHMIWCGLVNNMRTAGDSLEFEDIMMSLGTTAHTYEPYQGQTYNLVAGVPTKIPLLDGCNTVFTDTGNLHVEYHKSPTAQQLPTDIIAPTPDWESPIIVSGGSDVVVEDRNLLKWDAAGTDSILIGGGTINGVTFIPMKNGIIKVLGNPTVISGYVFTLFYGNQIDFLEDGKTYCSDKTVRIKKVNGSYSYGKQFTVDKKTMLEITPYIQRSVVNYQDGEIFYPQLSLGTTPHPYTPYQPPITLPLPDGFGAVGDVQDVIYSDGEKVWWDKKSEVVVFDGSVDENWSLRVTTGGKTTYSIPFSGYLFPVESKEKLMCDTYESVGGVGGFRAMHDAYPVGSIGLYSVSVSSIDRVLYINSSINNATEWRPYLQSNPLTVRYQLATPELIDITDTPTGIAYKQLQTYYPFTHLYGTAIEQVQPDISTTMKTIGVRT